MCSDVIYKSLGIYKWLYYVDKHGSDQLIDGAVIFVHYKSIKNTICLQIRDNMIYISPVDNKFSISLLDPELFDKLGKYIIYRTVKEVKYGAR
jgi:hypothetical protein